MYRALSAESPLLVGQKRGCYSKNHQFFMISIIIPTLNEERVIERTLKNLRTIHSVPYEIIVADTSSTDNTRARAEGLADKVVVYTGTEKPNASIIRNLGASHARGDILIFQDADVLLENADFFVRRVQEYMANNPSLVALAVATRFDPETQTLMDRLMARFINLTFFVLNNVLHSGGGAGTCQIVRRSAFEKIGGYDNTIPVSEDAVLFQNLARVGTTRFVWDIRTIESGRRQHAIGWPRLLAQWWGNWFSATFLGKSASSHWEEIR